MVHCMGANQVIFENLNQGKSSLKSILKYTVLKIVDDMGKYGKIFTIASVNLSTGKMSQFPKKV